MDNRLFTEDYFQMMNPADRETIFNLYYGGLRQPTQSQLNNAGLFSQYAQNILRNSNPELYLYLQQQQQQPYMGQ